MSFDRTINEMRIRAGLPPVDEKRTVTESAGQDEVTVYLVDDDDMMQTQEPTEVRLAVSYDVEPTEYDGPNVFYQGGVNVTGAKIYQSFEFLGQKYEHSQDFPEDLLRHVVRPNGETIHRSGQNPWNSFTDYLSDQLANYGDIHVPTQRHPDSRMTEADVDDSFLGRRQQQMQMATDKDVEGLQTELKTKLKIREQTSARLASTISDELALRMKRMVVLRPEQAEGKTAEQLLAQLAFSQEFDDYVEPILNNIKEQVRMDIKNKR